MNWAARPASSAAVSLLSAGAICLCVSNALPAFSQLGLYATAACVFSVGSSQEEEFGQQMLMEKTFTVTFYIFVFQLKTAVLVLSRID